MCAAVGSGFKSVVCHGRFDNQLGNEGARQVARMLHPGLWEVTHAL